MTERPLIPRRALFGNPSRAAPQISRDGRHLGWLQPIDGVMNLWVAPVDDLEAARPLTRSDRPIWNFGWLHDHRHLFYTDDLNGDENRRIWIVDHDTAQARRLTPERDVAPWIIALSPDRPGIMVVGLNQRDPSWHDAWEIDLATGERRLVFENRDGYGGYVFDYDLSLRMLSRQDRERGGWEISTCRDGRIEPLFHIPPEDEMQTGVLGFERDGTHYLLRTSIGRDTAALVRVAVATGEPETLFASDVADLHGFIRDPVTGRAVAASIEPIRREWAAIDPAVADDLRLIGEAAGDMDFNIYSQTADGRRWMVIVYGPEQPGFYHLWDRDSRTLRPLFALRPELEPYRFAPMRGIKIESRDGLDLVSYLTLPREVVGERPPEPLPMVLSVHGGPWARHQYGFNTAHQWLADRGYAVLSVNYRASTGFGKAFVNAGDREHAGRMHDDLIDVVDWAVREGIARKDRIAIGGASYGGYATLLGLTFTPEVFCCGVSLVGISNLITLLENMPPYWQAFAGLMYRRYHDPRTPEGREWLWSRSPLSRVEKITKPLLIGHGLNDVRCKIQESDQIVAAMRQHGLPVRYLVYPDEGHGFIRPENGLAFNAATEEFLAEHLGGRYEPLGHDAEGSSQEER